MILELLRGGRRRSHQEGREAGHKPPRPVNLGSLTRKASGVKLHHYTRPALGELVSSLPEKGCGWKVPSSLGKMDMKDLKKLKDLRLPCLGGQQGRGSRAASHGDRSRTRERTVSAAWEGWPAATGTCRTGRGWWDSSSPRIQVVVEHPVLNCTGGGDPKP